MSAKPKAQHFIPNSFQAPNVYVDEGIIALLTSDEVKVLFVALRKIMGWDEHRATRQDHISQSQFADATALNNETIAKCLKFMHEANILVKKAPGRRNHTAALYELNLGQLGPVNFDILRSRATRVKEANRRRTAKARQAIQADQNSSVIQTSTPLSHRPELSCPTDENSPVPQTSTGLSHRGTKLNSKPNINICMDQDESMEQESRESRSSLEPPDQDLPTNHPSPSQPSSPDPEPTGNLQDDSPSPESEREGPSAAPPVEEPRLAQRLHRLAQETMIREFPLINHNPNPKVTRDFGLPTEPEKRRLAVYDLVDKYAKVLGEQGCRDVVVGTCKNAMASRRAIWNFEYLLYKLKDAAVREARAGAEEKAKNELGHQSIGIPTLTPERLAEMASYE